MDSLLLSKIAQSGHTGLLNKVQNAPNPWVRRKSFTVLVPDDDAGLVDIVGVFEVGGGVADSKERSSKSSSSEK